MNLKLFFPIVLFVLSFSLAAALECSVTQNACSQPGEALILCLSDQSNAHTELPQSINGVTRCPNYEWKLCCKDSFVSNECSGNYKEIAWLKDATNSHTAMEKDNAYGIPICLSGLREVKCESSSFSGSTCLLSFSDKTNAHISGCEGEYTNKIYCSITSDIDTDGYSANIDCDDDNKDIRPDAVEIGDGVDNDCNGKIDGDDPSMLNFPKGWYQVSAAADKDKFSSYTAQGVEVKMLETGQRVFTITDSSRKGLLSQKIKIEKNKDYVARITSSCEATLQLVFDDTVAEKEKGGFFSFLFGQDLINSVTGKESISVIANSKEAEYAAIFIDVKEKDCQLSDPQLDLKGKVQPVEYNDAIQPNSLPVDLATPFPAAACCSRDTCWNGFTCVENMKDNTFIAESVTEKAVYRCVDGNWVFRAQLYDWNHQEFGSCPNEGQCFVLSSQKDASAEAKPNDFYEGKYPLCVNNGEYIFDHFCSDGNWVSRTQFGAEQLLKSTQDNDFTLYCTNPEGALVHLDNQDQFVLGDIAAVGGEQAGGLLGLQKKTPTRLCFPNLGENGKALIDDSENTCVNNVCLLEDKDGTISFATTLNKDVADPTSSFVKALGISPENFLSFCSGDGEYKTCVVEGISGEIYYSPTLNALIYSKEGLTFEPSLLEKIGSFFKSLFGGKEESITVIPADKAVPQMYLLKKGDKTIQAFVERTGKQNETLKANYSGFKTPICTFVEHLSSPTGEGQGVLGQLAGKSTFVCTTVDGTQNVFAEEEISYLWPQLTGKLRVE